jgi:uncharacterized protein YggL (DUF469 family)
MNQKVPTAKRYHKIDGWRGYRMPTLSIVGASDTGTWSDSPCPSDKVEEELVRFIKEVLKPNKIKYRRSNGESSNVFCGKRWISVNVQDFARAAQLAADWLDDNNNSTSYIHDADLAQIGYYAKKHKDVLDFLRNTRPMGDSNVEAK